jgi:hypothetical protein
MFPSVLFIRLSFSADLDSDPAFYLNVDPDPDPDPGSQTNVVWTHANPDLDSVLTLLLQKVEFLH